jgi:hypothetical protein
VPTIQISANIATWRLKIAFSTDSVKTHRALLRGLNDVKSIYQIGSPL